MSDEKAAYTSLRDHLIGRKDRINRVENPLVPGMFDVSVCLFPGVELWIEVKHPREPVKAGTPLFGSNHPVLQTQINWARTQLQAGGLAFYYIDTDKRRIMIHAKYSELVNSMTVAELVEHCIWGSLKPTPKQGWEDLNSILRGMVTRSEPSLTITSSQVSSNQIVKSISRSLESREQGRPGSSSTKPFSFTEKD